MPTPQYPNLANSFGQGSFIGAQQDLSQMWAAQQNEQLNQQEALAKQRFDAQQRPMTLATDAFNLEDKARKSDLANTLYPGEKANAVKKQQLETNKYDAPQMEQFGNSLLQLGTIAKQNGGVLQPWMKQSFNIPDELWQEIHAPGGADKFVAYGEAIIKNKDKFISQESKQGSAADIAATKADSAAEVARINAAARIKAAELANARAREALAAKPTKQDALSYEKYAQKLDAAADNLAMSGESEKAQYLKSLASDYYARAVKLKTAPTDVRTGSQEDLERELGVRKPAGQAAPAAPANNKPLDPLGIRK